MSHFAKKNKTHLYKSYMSFYIETGETLVLKRTFVINNYFGMVCCSIIKLPLLSILFAEKSVSLARACLLHSSVSVCLHVGLSVLFLSSINSEYQCLVSYFK